MGLPESITDMGKDEMTDTPTTATKGVVLSDAHLEAMLLQVDSLTTLPWSYRQYPELGKMFLYGYAGKPMGELLEPIDGSVDDNARFIVAAPQHIISLITSHHALTAERDAARDELTQQAWDMRSLEITVENLRAENERLREALRQVCNWSDAYPEDFFLFAEPDWIKARELLEAGGITLDSVSAGAIRRAVTDIGATSRAALEGGE